MRVRRKHILRSIPLALILLVLLGGWWFVDSLAYGNASSLHRAILHRNLGRAEELIRDGADVRAKMYAGLYPHTWNATPLHLAARGNLVQLVAPLLKAGAAIDDIDTLGYTPLLQALSCGSNETAQALVRAGATVHLATQSDRAAYALENTGQPLRAALQNASIETVKCLIEHGADPQSDIGPAAAAWVDAPDMLAKFELLTTLGCSLNQASDRSTPLITAAERDDAASIEFLLEHGADIEGTGGYDSFTPLLAASYAGSNQAVRILIKHGANVRAGTPGYGSPLYAAAFNKKTATVRLLLEMNLDLDLRAGRASDGWTPLDVARGNGDHETIELLTKAGAHSKSESDLETPRH